MPPKPKYTVQQRAQFLLWFAGCQEIYSQFEAKACSLLEANANIPDLRSLTAWKHKFLETGSVADKLPERQK
jgi:hypothetical protein